MNPIIQNAKSRSYGWHVWNSFKHLAFCSLLRHKHLFKSVWNGIKSIGMIILLLCLIPLSPVLCWILAYRNKRYVEQLDTFENENTQ